MFPRTTTVDFGRPRISSLHVVIIQSLEIFPLPDGGPPSPNLSQSAWNLIYIYTRKLSNEQRYCYVSNV